MARKQRLATVDTEVAALNAVVTAIQDLELAAQQRVVCYVIQRFKLKPISFDSGESPTPVQNTCELELRAEPDEMQDRAKPQQEEGLEGINAVARKWMSRNGLTPEGLSKLFSLGIDEIDLVARRVPGGNKKDRMRSVILLKGVASYLGGGAARVTHEQVKEACLHYDAFDTDNFAGYLKKMSAEVGGSKETGYTLTARGLTAATELIGEILNPSAKSKG